MMLLVFLEFTLSAILRLDFSTWCRKVWSNKYWKLFALMLELPMESFHLPDGSLLPNMCIESLHLAISTTALWLEWSCILMDTHSLTLLVLLNYAVRYIFCPKLAHEQDLKQMGCYLKTTSDKGLIMKPCEKLLQIDSFPDANFVGINGGEAMDDLVCVKSRTGYVNMVANYPTMWQFKLQPGTALSTMEVEIIVIKLSCNELFQFIDWVSITGKAIVLPIGYATIQV